MTSGAAFSFLIFLAYLIVGTCLVKRPSDKKENLASVQTAFGCIYLIVSLVYLFTGLQQVFHEADRPVADRAFALFSMYAAYFVTVPASYFCGYIIRGNLRYAWRLMVLFVAVACAGIGLTSTATMHPLHFSWGSTWDFDSLLLHAYIVFACCMPALVAVVLFIRLIFERLESSKARYRITLTTISFILIVGGWVVMPTGREPMVLASRLMLLLGALSALFAYYPPAFLAQRLEHGC